MTALRSLLRPWCLAAAAVALLALVVMQSRPVEAVALVTVSLNDTTAGAQTQATIDITLDTNLNPGATIVVTFPAGWDVQDGPLTNVVTAGFTLDPVMIIGDSAQRTVTLTLMAPQVAMGAPVHVTINASDEVVNPAAPANGLTITVDATGEGQAVSAPFNITAGGGGGGGIGATEASEPSAVDRSTVRTTLDGSTRVGSVLARGIHRSRFRRSCRGSCVG